MKGRRRGVLLALLVSAVPASATAHVGSPDVVFDGHAGMSSVRVVVRPPGVIPGRAQVLVRVLSGAPTAVSVQPVWWDSAREGGAPPPEAASRVVGERGLFMGSVWLMTSGSYSIRVTVTDAHGGGEVQVPVAALATRRLAMSSGMGAALAALGALLVAGLVSITGAAAREGTRSPSEAPGGSHRRRGRWAAAIASLAVTAGLLGGWGWWTRVDTRFREALYRPVPVTSRVHAAGGGQLLRLAIAGDAETLRRWQPLEPDHGKVMHLFLVREPGLDAFAHVHPIPTSRAHVAFFSALPALPAGRYRLYADVTHHDGLTQTLTDFVAVPPATGVGGVMGVSPDPDDVGGTSAALDGARGDTRIADLGDGFTIERVGGPQVSRAETALEFALRGPGGEVPAVEPYMGMRGHALVTRDDGSVFIHLHPSGTVSMAAQQVFARQLGGGGGHEGHSMAPAAALLSFPYEFPRPGAYRAWVQVRLAGRVRTGVFDIAVR
jgi:hypothetical protein